MSSLMELGVNCEKRPSLDHLDIELDELREKIQAADERGALQKPLTADRRKISLGAVLTEAISAAFWSDALLVCSKYPKEDHADLFSVLSSGEHRIGTASCTRADL